MKKLTLLIAILSVSFFAKAQGENDIKINILNALFYEINIEYEYGINENMSIGAFGGYVYGFPGAENYTKYGYFGPEFRYYVLPKRGIDRFYFGAYSRFKTGYTSASFQESGYLVADGSYQNYWYSEDLDYTKLAIGLTMGGKWVTKSGFIFGIQGGLGRNLFANYANSDFQSNQDLFIADTYYSYTERAGIDSEYWDFRIGFNVGWRIGK